MELNNLQLAFMALCGIAFIVYLIWRSESVDRITFLAREREEDKKQKERESDARDRRRMIYETDEKQKLMEADTYNEAANMEPMCGGSDAYTRSREAVARAQKAARDSMKP